MEKIQFTDPDTNEVVEFAVEEQTQLNGIRYLPVSDTHSPEEIAQLDKDMHRISLGRRILRTETAGMATLSMLIYELDI